MGQSARHLRHGVRRLTTRDEAEQRARAARLLEEIGQEFRFTRDYTGREQPGPALREALLNVPRDAFVDPVQQEVAWINAPLPIGHGQTISQPYIVALMTELLDVGPGSRVLEIGSGSGYQGAILSRLVREVWSVEVIAELAARAAERWRSLGYDNIHGMVGDGSAGWPEHAPYDGIIVTAAATEVPPALVEQLRPGARLVIPVGEPWIGQELQVITKRADGATETRAVLPVAFVPLVSA